MKRLIGKRKATVKKLLRFVLITSIGFACLLAIGNYAGNRYADVEKANIVNNVYADVSIILQHYVDKNEFPSSPEAVGINSVEKIVSYNREKSADFEFERVVEITSDAITITFGLGFDGDSMSTLVVAPIIENEIQIGWDCSGGDLAVRYRPSMCRD